MYRPLLQAEVASTADKGLVSTAYGTTAHFTSYRDLSNTSYTA